MNKVIDLLATDSSGEFRDIVGRRSAGAAEMFLAVRSLAQAEDPALAFVKYETLYSGSRTALAALGEFFGLHGPLLARFVRAAALAASDYRAGSAAAVKVRMLID